MNPHKVSQSAIINEIIQCIIILDNTIEAFSRRIVMDRMSMAIVAYPAITGVNISPLMMQCHNSMNYQPLINMITNSQCSRL